MNITESIFLGLIQGLTEFLPVSSTGHLILSRLFFGGTENNALAFDAVLHLATVAAVVIYFRKDLWQLLQTGMRMLGRLPVENSDAILLKALLIGTVPAVLLGVSLESLMATIFRAPLLVAGVLVAGSVLFIYAEWRYAGGGNKNGSLTVKKGLLIGFFQCLALVPGMSRSGSTIVGGMLLGLTRTEAARFAFLLAVPVIGGAGMKKLLELMSSSEAVYWPALGAGAAVAFFSGLAAIHFMLSFVRRHTLWPFIWYRLVLAAIVAYVVLLG